MNDDDKIISGNPSYEPRYWMRVWIVGKALAIGWRRLPYEAMTFWGSAKEFGRDLRALLLAIILPLTFIAAPLWLWLLDRDNKKIEEHRRQAAKAWMDRNE